MAFTTKSDYRIALRQHRVWSATVSIALISFLATLFPVYLVLWIVGLDHSVVLLLTTAALLGLGLTWADAAQRTAGARNGRGTSR